ncbi:MAG: 3-ketoacyl-ACP reductase [Planctomycetes bacterium]|nr:3-ketoacyl-ACP reductase [Planctomycetota bacterium]
MNGTAKQTGVALVTGGSRGIGRGIAVELGRQGWKVVINYASNADAAKEAVGLIEQAGGQAAAVQADLSQTAQRKYMLDFAVERFGTLTALVNNAGVAPQKRADLLEMGEESFDRVLDVNLKGPFFLTQQAARRMIQLRKEGKLDRGYIVNITSISVYTASINRGEYCIAKAGLGMVTALFAARLAEENILAYEIRPGVIATDMTSGVKEKYDKLIDGGLTPIKRWGTPEDIGLAVGAILRGSFPFSTGAVFDVDGGFHLRTL